MTSERDEGALQIAEIKFKQLAVIIFKLLAATVVPAPS